MCFDWGAADPETCDRLIAEAAHVVRLRLRNPRIVVNALEPRTAVGLYDPDTGQYRLIATTQGVHLVRRVLAVAFGIPEDRLRVLTPQCRRRVRIEDLRLSGIRPGALGRPAHR